MLLYGFVCWVFVLRLVVCLRCGFGLGDSGVCVWAKDAGCCALIVGVCVGCFWVFVVLVGLVGFMFGVLAYWLGCLGGFGWLFCLW